MVLGRVEEGEGGGVGWEGMMACWEDRMVVGESKWEGWRVGGGWGLSTPTFRGLEVVKDLLKRSLRERVGRI